MKFIKKFLPYLFLALLAFAQIAYTSSVARSARSQNKALTKSHTTRTKSKSHSTRTKSKSRQGGDQKFGAAAAANTYLHTAAYNRPQENQKFAQSMMSAPALNRARAYRGIAGIPDILQKMEQGIIMDKTPLTVWAALKKAEPFDLVEVLVGVVKNAVDHVGTVVGEFWDQLKKRNLIAELRDVLGQCGTQFNIQIDEAFSLIDRQARGQPNETVLADWENEQQIPTEFKQQYCSGGECDPTMRKDMTAYILNCGAVVKPLNNYGVCVAEGLLTFVGSRARDLFQAFKATVFPALKSIGIDLATDFLKTLLGILFAPIGVIIRIWELIKGVYELGKMIYKVVKIWKKTNRIDFFSVGEVIGLGIALIKNIITGRRRKMMKRYRK